MMKLYCCCFCHPVLFYAYTNIGKIFYLNKTFARICLDKFQNTIMAHIYLNALFFTEETMFIIFNVIDVVLSIFFLSIHKKDVVNIEDTVVQQKSNIGCQPSYRKYMKTSHTSYCYFHMLCYCYAEE